MKILGWKTIPIALLFGGPIYLFFLHDRLFAYINWKTLTKQEVIKKAEIFLDRRDLQNYACLYVVECIDDEAHLRMIKNIDAWDIEATKQTVWNRRFHNVCTGRTANIAINYSSATINKWTRNNKWTIEASDNAGIWSFSSNSFSAHGRFSSGSFSQKYGWESCTEENAIVSRKGSK